MNASSLMPKLAMSLAAACTLLAASPAHALADDEARRAILDLRQQLRQMNEQNQRARLLLADQIEQLQQEVARLRGQIEEAARPAQAQQPAQQRGQGAAGVAQAEDPQEQAAYDGALDLFRNGQYREAAESLTAFLTLYPDSALAPNARFYLGSSRYALKDYKGAIDQLRELVEAAPEHSRAPDALLVIAGSQVELNDRAGAKASLQRIVKDYPGTPAAETASKRLQLL